MKRFFGSDNIAFTAHTQDTRSPVASRSFTSFSQAAQEDALSRLWLGVHYRWDATDGLTLGDTIAATSSPTRCSNRLSSCQQGLPSFALGDRPPPMAAAPTSAP